MRRPEEQEDPKRILIVDDEEGQLRELEDFFKSLGHEIELARDGFEALAKMKLGVDLVLLDVKMPGMDGYEVAKRIRENPAFIDVPVVMVTALDSKEDRLRAVEAGANDFVSKPIDVTELRVRTGFHLKMKEARNTIKRQQWELEERVREKTAALRTALQEVVEAQRKTYEAHLDTIRRLAVVAEHKDKGTAAHIQRVREYCGLLAEGLRLPPGEVELIHHASPMHDVGKVIVAEHILLKPGELDPGEWEIMRQHTVAGGQILTASSSELLQVGERIALSHHERWDGTGYPRGLAGEDIPAAGRICAVADVFDALMSERPYKKAFPAGRALEILREGRGKHFDPRVLDLFLKRRKAFIEIQKKYAA